MVPKSTNTLLKRFSSLRLFRAWFDTAGLEKRDFLTEGTLFAYCRFLHLEGAPATRAACARQAFNFFLGMLGQETRAVQKSARIHGLCVALLRTRGAVRQRRPLTVKMIHTLEQTVIDDDGLGHPDALVAGAALMAVFGRARIGDLARCPFEPTLEVDLAGGGYIETRFDRHKTSRPGSRRSLPISASALGLLGSPWAKLWLEAREIAGQDAAVQQTILPAATADGGWHAVPLLTQEYGAVLRSFFMKSGYTAADLQDIGCHSCKATCLSWSARFGLACSARRLLGYHMQPGDRALESYSRDAMAAPLRELDTVVAAIRDGKFDPEATRSGQHVAPAPPSPSSTCSSSRSEEDSQDDEDLDGLPVVPAEVENAVVKNIRTEFFHISDGEKTRCGNLFSKNFVICQEVPAGGKLCPRCW